MSSSRRREHRRATAIVVVAVAALALTCGGSLPRVPAQAVPSQTAAAIEKPLFRFVSMPDFINADIGDLSQLPGWHPGDPNSINGSWRKALDVILDQIRAERPAAVLVAGDLVDGRWLRNATGSRVFGPTKTWRDRLHVVAAAGRLYYSQYWRRFAVRGLRLLPALGDHDIGNDPWPFGSLKLAAVSVHKQAFEDVFTRRAGHYRFSRRPRGTPAEGTAYAVRVADTLIVTVDEFRRTWMGVKLALERGQLRWLEQLFRNARENGVEHIIVQGHLPVLAPDRAVGSSRLMLAGGASSPFWRLLRRFHVDLYLAGEFHAASLARDGVVQVVHGSLTWTGKEEYLLGTVYPDRIVLELKQFTGRVLDPLWLWQYEGQRCSAHLSFDPGPSVVGGYVVINR